MTRPHQTAQDATLERWRRRGFDLRYGPRWYLHYDGIPPQDDESSYVWSVAAQCWQRDWDDEDDSAALPTRSRVLP